MVRNYVRKVGSRRYRDYSQEELEEALERVRNGESARRIGEEYGIPYVTLYRKIKGLHSKTPGGQTILSAEEEESIVGCIITAAKWGFPMPPEDVKRLVQNYLNERGRKVQQFQDNKPGEGWLEKFLKRHDKDLSKRISQPIKESRAKINHETINKYFDSLAVALEGISPEALVNYDETNFTDDPGRIKVVVRRSSKRAEQMIDTSKAATSVMFSCSASGVLLPVYVVYKADHLWSTWTEKGPPKARYNRSKSGWFDTKLFEEWFFSIIVPYFQTISGPKALIGDNLASHISVSVIRKCEELNIRFILLPPNSTQLTQPLDVCVFRPIKGAWRSVLREWKKHNRGVVRKEVFPRLLHQALNSIQRKTEANIRAGFEATGIYPLNREMVLKRLPKETDHQAVDPVMSNSMIEMFKKARYKNGEISARGRKKKLNVEPGRSISEIDLIPDATSTLGTRQKDFIEDGPSSTKKRKKSKQKKYIIDSSSESDGSVQYAESDLDPETFSDLEDGVPEINDNQQITKNGGVTDEVLSKEDFVLVSMKTDSGTTKEYVAKIISLEEVDSFFCTFLRRSNKIKNAFIFPPVEDTGIVHKNEILEKLSQFEVLRRGQIKFSNCHKLEKSENLA